MTEADRITTIMEQVYAVLPDATKDAVDTHWQAVLLAVEPHLKNLLQGETIEEQMYCDLLDLPENLCYDVLYYIFACLVGFGRVSPQSIEDRFDMSQRQINHIRGKLGLTLTTVLDTLFWVADMDDRNVEIGAIDADSMGADIAKECEYMGENIFTVMRNAIMQKKINIGTFLKPSDLATKVTEELLKAGGQLKSINASFFLPKLSKEARSALQWDTITFLTNGTVMLNPRNPALLPEKTMARLRKEYMTEHIMDLRNKYLFSPSILKMTLVHSITLDKVREQYASSDVVKPERVYYNVFTDGGGFPYGRV